MSKQGFLKVGHYKKSMGQSSKRETRRPRGHSLKLIKKKKKVLGVFMVVWKIIKMLLKNVIKLRGLEAVKHGFT